MARHLDHLRGGVAVAVACDALEMRMELEVVDRELSVALDEADRDDALAQDALDAERDFSVVRALDEHPAPLGFDDSCVVDPDASGARERRLLVGIHRARFQSGISAFKDAQDVPRALP